MSTLHRSSDRYFMFLDSLLMKFIAENSRKGMGPNPTIVGDLLSGLPTTQEHDGLAWLERTLLGQQFSLIGLDKETYLAWQDSCAPCGQESRTTRYHLGLGAHAN